MSSIEYPRIYSDPEGISHFETKSLELELVESVNLYFYH